MCVHSCSCIYVYIYAKLDSILGTRKPPVSQILNFDLNLCFDMSKEFLNESNKYVVLETKSSGKWDPEASNMKVLKF